MGSAKSRRSTPSPASASPARAQPPRSGRSNAEAQARLASAGPSFEASAEKGGGSIGGSAWRGSASRGPVSVEGTVGQVGASGTLSNARDRRGGQHPSAGLSVGGSVAAGQMRVGTPDNNARLGVDLGFGFSAGSTVSDVDRDGVPERNIDLSIGPFTIGWTTEDILSVMSAARYSQLQRQAEAEVKAQMGTFVNGDKAGGAVRARLKQLVDAEVRRARGRSNR
jgi:hypothetical protein